MAVVKGIKERVHLPIYDCINVEPEKQLRDVESSSTLKFFLDVQGKTKLETNLQSAGLLPHYNTFEARAMRVVISDLPPAFPSDRTGSDEDVEVTLDDPQGNAQPVLAAKAAGNSRFYRNTPAGVVDISPPVPQGQPPAPAVPALADTTPVVADLELGLDQLMDLLHDAREDEGEASVDLDDDGVTLRRKGGGELSTGEKTELENLGASISLSASDIEKMIEDMEDKKYVPPREQIRPNDGVGTLLGKFVYNTVTTFYVGEKVMIQMPTWFFPAGAGPYSQHTRSLTHGEPNPTATFRFAEPIFIEKQQNFRVEIEIPDSDTLKQIQRTYGPLKIWVVLDGYMTRNVQ